MNVIVTLEYRFDRTPDGSVWTETQFQYPFWERYLNVFDQVSVVARVRELSEVPDHFVRADGPNVSFIALPCYLGPKQYLANQSIIKKICRSAIPKNDAMILRVPSILANAVIKPTQKGRPYGLEVVGDPYDVFAPGVVKHPLRAIFRKVFFESLKRQCANACAASYVTKNALQRRYPTGKNALSVACSDIQLRQDNCVDALRVVTAKSQMHMVSIGSLAQTYKAIDILLEAMAQCVQGGLDLTLTVVGDGRYRGELEALAQELGIGKRVQFLGQVPAGKAIEAQLDAADLFVLPSRTEGLPRVIIEAMARAVPCIGSTVGGIPELLEEEDMVPPDDVAALAAKIQEVLTDPARMTKMSARNLEKSKEYREDILSERRTDFYKYVRQQTETWVAQRQRSNR